MYGNSAGGGTTGKIILRGSQALIYAGTAVVIDGASTGAIKVSTTLLLDGASTGKIALGASASAITVAGTEAGFIVDGSGYFKLYQNATNYIRYNASGLDIKSTTFDLLAGTAGAGQIALNTTRFAIGSTLPTAANSGTGIFINNTGIYGLSSNTQNFILSAANGQITANAGIIAG